MKNFKRLLVGLALVFALSLGVLTTAFANADAQLPEGGDKAAVWFNGCLTE